VRKILHIKLKAGALQYTILVAVIIALLIFSVVSLSYTQQLFKASTIQYLKSIHNTNLAVDYATTTELPYNDIVEKQFLEELKDISTIEKHHWGVFDFLNTRSSIKKQNFSKNVLIGGLLVNRPSLYIKDNNEPLVLVGNTRVEGNVFLSKQGVKRGTIGGKSYLGTQLIYGKTHLSDGKLPQLKNKSYLKQLSQGIIAQDNAIPLELYENASILNSFSKPVQIYLSDSLIDLRLVKLTGHIIIQSKVAIKVSASALLTDVLLIAPKIEILDKVTGNFQAIASKNIIIHNDCKLTYPTSLIVYEKVSSILKQNNIKKYPNRIEIQSGTEVRGVVGFLSDNTGKNYKPQIILEENTTVFGEVYCSKRIELKGTVKGTVFTNGFIANQFGSIYQNHIYNGHILSSNFPVAFCGLPVEGSQKRVAKWLY